MSDSSNSAIAKIVSVALIAILIANILLLALGVISWRLFWVVIIVVAILAYYGIPRLKKRT